MSDHWEIIIMMPEGLPAREVVQTTHQVISELDGIIDEDCLLILHDTATESPDVEYVEDSQAALEKLSTWSELGGIEYYMPDGMMTVEYAGPSNSGVVEYIKITIPNLEFFKVDGEESKNRYINLAKVLHSKLQAKRTIMDWNVGLLYTSEPWNQEMNRLKNSEFIGEHLIDIRRIEERSNTGMVA
ncbi:hypothetical protein DSM106972_024100 [Dulcicalothrix desertica PCC 7102]|uniref:Uncharacterized protein n=1 Tax=Dulcicalothrix desertica PCC 7102 TaxID=232991 RepID=A0A433VM40_9CYAN|nr:hypothetical protein [Dulcicalothrix desertica]RUT07149.1 hypothetical protein DSM106972_024100 [Dulcicalothrix desertica PCC 7102]TWH61855.1 hypothetical protein CAL7102_00532 [Dulcicalothrix desertica PCC 7102]